MNKELILKYKAEFDHWLNGGKLQVKFVNDPWEEAPKDIFSYNAVNFVLVIDDEYVEFRKAGAEGKIVEFKHPQVGYDEWEIVTPEHLFQSIVSGREYRIKPEEPKFKVGDWVIDKKRKHKPFMVTSSDLEADSPNYVKIDCELWQPKPGEFCWFWNFTGMPRLEQFSKYYDLDGHLGNYETLTTELYHYCEPFIGQLPTYLRK